MVNALRAKNKIRTYSIYAVSAWLLVNLVQAYLSPLHVDEAYYWMFSRFLDWGYFDHPPAVAVLIKASSFIFEGNMGIRFLSILCQLLTFYLMFMLLENERRTDRMFLKYLLVLMLLPLHHVFGFITTPDVPLMLSTTLFFYALKRVLDLGDGWSYGLWSLSMAMMLYSKYHSGLVIVCVLIALPHLFKRWQTYCSGLVALILYIPHVWWQYQHDWVSFVYHLKERGEGYEWTFPMEYLLIIVLVFNPVFLFQLVRLIRKRWKGTFERACYIVVVGFLLFFLWQSFRVRVQPQWLIVLYIPSLYLMRREIDKVSIRRLVLMFLALLPILVFLRVCMIVDVLPIRFNMHGEKEYVEQIQQDAKGRDVMFYSSYKRAAIYNWYSGQEYTHSYNGVNARKNQYDIWSHDSIYYHQDVYFVGVYQEGREPTFYKDGTYFGNVVTYKPSRKMQVNLLNSKKVGQHLISEFTIDSIEIKDIKFSEQYVLTRRYLIDGQSFDYGEDILSFKLEADAQKVYSVSSSLPLNPEVNGFVYLIRHENLPHRVVYESYDFPLID